MFRNIINPAIKIHTLQDLKSDVLYAIRNYLNAMGLSIVAIPAANEPLRHLLADKEHSCIDINTILIRNEQLIVGGKVLLGGDAAFHTDEYKECPAEELLLDTLVKITQCINEGENEIRERHGLPLLNDYEVFLSYHGSTYVNVRATDENDALEKAREHVNNMSDHDFVADCEFMEDGHDVNDHPTH